MSSTLAIPRISVTMVSLPSDRVDELSFDHHTAGQKPVPPKIDTAHAQQTISYADSDTSSSSDSSESDEDNEHEDDVTPPQWRHQKPYRPTHTLSPPSYLTLPKLRKPRSPFSPLRNSFTAPDDEEHVSPSSNSSLPEDKKGLDKERFEGLLRASRERRANLMASMRIQTTGLTTPPAPRVKSPNTTVRRTMDLRKEITLKVHAAKHEERRQTFLARLLASPSSSPTTLTTPVTPPDSPAVFHYRLPSPGLLSPLALFEALDTNGTVASEDRGDRIVGTEGENAFERVERVNWAHEARNSPVDDDEPGSPPARVAIGGTSVMSLGMGMESIIHAQQARRKAQNRLPFGAGCLQFPNNRLHTKTPTAPVGSTPANVPPNSRVAALSPSTKPASSTLNGNRNDATVVVPPRRNASLLRPLSTVPVTRSGHATAVTSSPTTSSRSHHLPSLNEITERLNASKVVNNVKNATPMAPHRRSNLAPIVVRAPPAAAGDQRPSARSAAFPDFLRERRRRQGTNAHIENPMVDRGIDVSKRAAGAPVASSEKDDSVLVLPPARPKSVDVVLQERVLRGNVMVAKLSLSHRRRKSESATEVEKLKIHPPVGRAGGGWF